MEAGSQADGAALGLDFFWPQASLPFEVSFKRAGFQRVDFQCPIFDAIVASATENFTLRAPYAKMLVVLNLRHRSLT